MVIIDCCQQHDLGAKITHHLRDLVPSAISSDCSLLKGAPTANLSIESDMLHAPEPGPLRVPPVCNARNPTRLFCSGVRPVTETGLTASPASLFCRARELDLFFSSKVTCSNVWTVARSLFALISQLGAAAGRAGLGDFLGQLELLLNVG